MPGLPIKKLSFRIWLQIFGIWTLAALSMATQMYLNTRQTDPEASWIPIFLKQLPTWYLCALLTPVIIFVYERYPLDTPTWKRNLISQIGIALLTLSVFAHPRMLAMSFIVGNDIQEMSGIQYLRAYLGQIAWDAAIYSFIVAVIFADKANAGRKKQEIYAAHIELLNKELQNQLNAAQLEALKLQLSPHFLFNTLNTVSSLIRTGEYTTAIQVNARLGDFLRVSLHAGQNQLVSFEREMEFVDLYLKIESVRFRDRLQIVKAIHPDCWQAQVPQFILQPIIENAIKHGIAKQSNARQIAIKASMENGFLAVQISNEGKPLPANWQEKANGQIGLRNVHNRLEKMYGTHFSFRIANTINQPGVQVIVRIPHTYTAYAKAW